MRVWARTVLCFAICCAAGSGLAQKVIHVPADQPTIQAGIDAAQNGDTVLVAPGTYSESIDFKGKNITVTSGATSSSGAAATIISGWSNSTPAVYLHNGESSAAVLNGFTFENGRGTAIAMDSSSATISNNAFLNFTGCAISAIGSTADPLIEGNEISGILPGSNSTYCFGGIAGYGTGISVEEAYGAEILRNTVKNGMQFSTSDELVSICPPIDVGDDSAVLIENNVIYGNDLIGQAISEGSIPNISIIQNLIYGNIEHDSFGKITAEDFQGPVYLAIDGLYSTNNEPQTIVFSGNTIFGNTDLDVPSADGSQFQFEDNSELPVPVSATIENNLFISTETGAAAECEYGYGINAPSITFSYDDVLNEGTPQPAAGCMDYGPAVADLAVDPQFIDPSTGNFHTERTSPVVAAGDINAPMIPATDLDGKNRTVCGTIDMGVYEVHPKPPIVVSGSPNPSVGGTSVTFTAQLTGNCNVPTGTVTFMDGTNVLGTGTLNSAALASFTTSSLTVGTHMITAAYPGDFNFARNTSAPYTQVVTGYPTSALLVSVTPNPAQAFQTITLSATVASNFGTPNGTVTFYSGSQMLATAPVNSSGNAMATVNTLGAGSYQITASYNATTNYAASTSAPVTLIVNGVTTKTVLSSTPNPSIFGQSVMFSAAVTAPGASVLPTGTVTFSEGATVLGSGAVSSSGTTSFDTSTLSIGSHTITASYGGSSNDAVSTSNAIIQVVDPVQSSVSLTATPNPAALGKTVTLTATISLQNSSLPPSGTVTFSDQFGTIGSVAVTGGRASFTTSSLTAGTHTITAVYSGSNGFSGATSNTVDEVIQSFDFSISLSPSTLSLASGKSGSVMVQLQGVGNLPGDIVLSASQVPQYASLSFSPTAAQFAAAGSGSAVLSINTLQLPQETSGNDQGAPLDRTSEAFLAGLIGFPLLFLKRRGLKLFLCAVLAVAAMSTLSGCTNIYRQLNHVAPGTYEIPVTGVDQSSGITHSAILTVVVTS